MIKIVKILRDLLITLPSTDADSLIPKINDLIIVIEAVDATGEGPDQPIDSSVDFIGLKRLYETGRPTAQQKLQYAEMLESLNMLDEAKIVAEDLIKEYPKNETIIRLHSRLFR